MYANLHILQIILQRLDGQFVKEFQPIAVKQTFHFLLINLYLSFSLRMAGLLLCG